MNLLARIRSAIGVTVAVFALLVPCFAWADCTNPTSGPPPTPTQEDFTGITTANNWLFYNGACLTAGNVTTTASPGKIPGCQTVLKNYYAQPHGPDNKMDYYLSGGNNGWLGDSTAPTVPSPYVAGSYATQTPDPKCSGALRFTNGYPFGGEESGAIVSTSSLATDEGLEITFKTTTYLGNSGGSGGDGADGLSFYLMDACLPLTGLASTDYPGGCGSGTSASALYKSIYPGIGAFGGSLAYTCSNSNSPFDGLVGGYIGVGIDEFGNFLNGTTNTLGTSTGATGDNTASGGGYAPGRIALRGAGNISWNALTTAYGLQATGMPYYPATLATTCSNKGAYNPATGTCGVVCTTGVLNVAGNTCEICPAGTTFYQGTTKCNSCSTGTYDPTTGTCNPAYVCASGNFYAATTTCNTCNSSGTYNPATGGCAPVATCSTGTYYPTGNQCNSCTAGTYDPVANTCSTAFTCATGTYDPVGKVCTPVCSTGTYFATPKKCETCATGTLNTSSGTAYCDTICPAGYTYEATASNLAYPTQCYKCSKGVIQQPGGSGTAYSCTLGGVITPSVLKAAAASAPTIATPVATLKTKVVAPVQTLSTVPATPVLITSNPTTAGPLSGATYYRGAVQKTCKTGNLFDYTDPNNPVVVGPAVPGAPYNPVNIADYAPLLNAAGQGAYSILSTVKIAAESAQTRVPDPTGVNTKAATSIFYDMKLTKDGRLTFSYSLNGAAYFSVIKDQPIVTDSSGNSINGPLPSAFRFGFAGSTGGSTNVHEILCFKASPVKEAGGSTSVNQKQSSKIQPNEAQAYFGFYDPSPTVWTGNVTANVLKVSNAGVVTVDPSPQWDAQCGLTGGTCVNGSSLSSGMDYKSRVMLSYNGSKGIPFRWGNLASDQQTALSAQTLVDYLRGDRTNEIPTGKLYRTRDGILSDIVESNAVWVGPPISPYTAKWVDRLHVSDTAPEAAATRNYATFVSDEQQRVNVVYAGANDGFVHGFRAAQFNANNQFDTVDTPNDGAELIAYMPKAVSKVIHDAGTLDADLAVDFPGTHYGHNFYVDATPGTGDLYYGGVWHTWLVGGLGAGGQGIYALDITDPTGAGPNTTSFTEGNAAALVIGEWNSSTITCNAALGGSTCGSNLGNTYGTPLIRRLHNGRWGFIFGNGAASASNDAGIFIFTIDPADPTKRDFYYLSTGYAATANPAANGIEFISSGDLDGDHITDYIYAGDLQGNVWRFDLTADPPDATTPPAWSAGAAPIFSTGGQPITSAPVVASIPISGGAPRVMLAFGTGKKIQLTNSTPVNYAPGQQALYGVEDWDMDSWNSQSSSKYFSATGSATAPKAPATSSSLNQMTITCSGTAPNIVCDNSTTAAAAVICWVGTLTCPTDTQVGWYLPLPNGNAKTGYEQSIFNPTLYNGVFIVDSTIPGDNTPTSCTSTLDQGITYAMNIATGTPVPNFFTQYKDSNAIGVETDATGTPQIVNTAMNTTAMIYQTVSGNPGATQINPPPNTKANRLTWIELR